MTFTYGHDLFAESNKVIVIPTNCVGVQGAGLAKMAAEHWPRWSAWYSKACRAGRVHPGDVLGWCAHDEDLPVYAYRKSIWTTSAETHPILLSVATKDHWRQPSRLEWVRVGLSRLEEDMAPSGDRRGIRVGLPALGCGRGGLDFEVVRPMLERTAQRLGEQGYDVTLYAPQ